MSAESEELLARLLSHAPNHLLLLDAAGTVLYVNRLVGSDKNRVMGQRLVSLLPPGQQSTAADAMERARVDRTPQRYEVVYDAPQGPRTFESQVSAVFEDDVHVGFAVSSEDITERVETSRDFERFFEVTEELLAVVGLDGTFIRVSPSFASLGVDPAHMVGKSHFDLIHPDDHEAVRRAMHESRARVEFRLQLPNGEQRIIAGFFSRSDAQGGRVYGAARDVTEQRLLERQLLRSQKLEAVGQLAGGVAHDFNNLLLGVMINAEHALEELEPGHPAVEYIQDLQTAAQLSADLTKQLLAFSRRRTHRPREVDLNEVASRILSVVRRTIPESVDIDMIPGHALGWIHADPGQLEQMLLNLALNARDAMPQGGRLTITTQNVVINGEYRRTHPWAKPGRYVLLTVADTGVGIPEELRESVFEPFFSTKGPGEGTGLGLTIVHDVVQRHDGMIDLYSEPGRGTTFKIYLPVSIVAASSMPGRPEGPVPSGRETVLLAEDEHFVRRAVSRILTRAGYRVLVANDGRDALRQIEGGAEPDLLLLDVVMPVMSGPELVRRLRQMGRKYPVILASGYSDAVLQEDALEGIPLIEKPYEPDALLRLVRAELDRHAPERSSES